MVRCYLNLVILVVDGLATMIEEPDDGPPGPSLVRRRSGAGRLSTHLSFSASPSVCLDPNAGGDSRHRHYDPNTDPNSGHDAGGPCRANGQQG